MWKENIQVDAWIKFSIIQISHEGEHIKVDAWIKISIINFSHEGD